MKVFWQVFKGGKEGGGWRVERKGRKEEREKERHRERQRWGRQEKKDGGVNLPVCRRSREVRGMRDGWMEMADTKLWQAPRFYKSPKWKVPWTCPNASV